MKRKFLALLLSFCMALSLLPVSALAEGGDESSDTSATSVAKIGETIYTTLDEAIEQAENGATIELLADATANKTFSKSLTFTGGYTVNMDVYGWRYTGNLVFDGANLNINTDANSPIANNTEAYKWFTMVLGGSITAKNKANIKFVFDSSCGTNCAIYTGSGGVTINVENSSTFSIIGKNTKGVTGQGIQLDSTANTGIYVTDNSQFLIDGTNRGYVNSPTIYVKDSTFTVQNCTSNASNGGNFTTINSEINFLNNAGHGLSATNLVIQNSTVTCNNNAYYGVTVGTKMTMDGTSELTANENGTGFTGGALRLANSSTIGTFDSGAKVELKGNYRNALENYGTCTFENGVKLEIMNNTAPDNGAGIFNGANGKLTLPDDAVVMYNKAAQTGGGVCNRGTVTIPNSVSLYNNHASTAGDDIYNTGTITFGAVGSDWRLDGDEDNIGCSDAIDGWYLDGYDEDNTRWEAHTVPYYVQEFELFDQNGTASVEGNIALKAAHKLIPVEDSDRWEISKSKTADNLVKQSDGTYTSDVTLSLPAADYKPSVDVVMVIDVSSSMKDADINEAKAAATAMCDELSQKTNVDVKVGIVTFDKTAHQLTSGLVDINTAENAINEIVASSGTNMMAGLIAGKELLDAGTAIDKYLILMSDGIPIYWADANGNPCNKTLEFYAKDGTTLTGTREAGAEPEDSNNDFSSMLTMEEILSATDWDTDSDTWKVISDTGVTIENGYTYSNIQKSTYMTAQYMLKNIIGQYHMKMVAFGTDKYDDNVVYKYGENFCDWIGQQTDVSYYKISKPGYGGTAGQLTQAFEEIVDELIQLVDAGSSVIDVIGSGTDDKGNAYNFDFVNSSDNLILTVGGKAQDVTELTVDLGLQDNNETARYGFGTSSADIDGGYPFVLHYYANGQDGNSDECFVWDINVPVTKDETVQLTYTVQLTNPQTTTGIYGTYDADGSEKLPGLYTNNSATLYPMDSNGEKGLPETFPKPTVSYEVKAEKPTKPTNPANPTTPVTPPPALNTEDHFAYIIGYPVDYYTGEPTDDQTKKPVKPEGNITRAEVATIFFRLLTDEVRNEYWSQTCEYSDVDIDDWFNNAVCTLSNFGILKGYEDGTFRPNGNITRAEFATIAVRFFEVEYNGKDLFPDIDGHWAQDYINQAGFAGLVEGYPDGTFGPEKLITRAEAVTIVNRTIDRHPDKEHLLDDMLVWPDNMDTTKWYYADMQEATNSHEYTMHTKTAETESQTKYEIWQKILPVRDWEAFEKAWADANAAANPGEVVR